MAQETEEIRGTAATQIFANLSVATKQRMEPFVSAHRVKEFHFDETALLYYLRALDEIPPDMLIPPSLVLSREWGARVLDRIEHPLAPTAAVKALFDD